jgi:hypothetical protein
MSTGTGFVASNPPVGLTDITIFRIANGKLIEDWTNEDVLGMLQQIGAVPAPEQV